MSLNEKIVNILKQHSGGEEFFNALDFMIRADRDILSSFLDFVFTHYCENNCEDIGVIVSGNFGQALLSNHRYRLDTTFGDIIITNGGLREGREAVIYKEEVDLENWIFLDDSYYSGTTQREIERAIKTINPEASIVDTFIVYDGSGIKRDKVKSMFRYYK